MKFASFFCTVFLLFTFVSAHGQDKFTIVILGDSLTEGYGLSKESAFPALLEKKLKTDKPNVEVINAGVSGSTSAGGLSRVDWVLKSSPKILVVALGANDGLRGLKPQELKKNLTKITEKAREKKVQVLLLGMKMPPNYGKQYTKDFEAVYGQVAAEQKVPLLPFLLQDVAGIANLNLPDGIHPNEKGHELLTNRIYPFVKKYL